MHREFLASIPGLATSPTVTFRVARRRLLLRGFRSGDIQLLFKNRKWACIGLLAYAGAAVFAACRPRYSSGTYIMWLVPPITYLAAAPLARFQS